MSAVSRALSHLWTRRCPSCNGSRFVPGDGRPDARVALVGEGPGRVENAIGRPFVGDSGQELDGTYLPLGGLRRSDVYVTNVQKCKPGRTPKDDEARQCAETHLWAELRLVRPTVVVALGAIASRILGGDISLERDHGIVRRVSSHGISFWLMPTYHPAAALRGGLVSSVVPVMSVIEDDFRALARWLTTGEAEVPTDAYPNPDYREIKNPSELRNLIPNSRIFLGMDTESDNGRTWSVQVSPRPGTGYLISADDARCLTVLRSAVADQTVALHFAEHDLDALAQVGIRPPSWVDTQRMAYRLQAYPQGLKPLAYRACGMSMSGYEDLVLPYSRRALWVILTQWWAYLGEGRERTAVGHIMKHIDSPTYDAWGKIGEHLSGETLAELRSEFGDIPKPSITHVPRHLAIDYACRDPDATGRVAERLWEEMREFGKEVTL